MDSEFPPEVKRIIDAFVASMDHVDVLLQLRQSGGRATTISDLVAGGDVDRVGVMHVLNDLEAAGVVSESEGLYRYEPSEADAEAIDSLWDMYRRRPVTLIRAVYARPAPMRRP